MKKIAILYSEYSPVIDAIKYQLNDFEIDALKEINDASIYDLVILCNYSGDYEGNAVKCHHSLLPAFDGKEPEKEAILEGVKVTGITIYFTNPKKIIAQYPIFITNSMHYEDLMKEMEYLEQTIYPIVAQKILNNEAFELQSIMNKGCGNNCKGCASCNH